MLHRSTIIFTITLITTRTPTACSGDNDLEIGVGRVHSVVSFHLNNVSYIFRCELIAYPNVCMVLCVSA